MTRDQLIKAIRRWCRRRNILFTVSKQGGKGSHYKVRVGDRWTIIQSGEMYPRYTDTVLEQLGIPKEEIGR